MPVRLGRRALVRSSRRCRRGNAADPTRSRRARSESGRGAERFASGLVEAEPTRRVEAAFVPAREGPSRRGAQPPPIGSNCVLARTACRRARKRSGRYKSSAARPFDSAIERRRTVDGNHGDHRASVFPVRPRASVPSRRDARRPTCGAPFVCQRAAGPARKHSELAPGGRRASLRIGLARHNRPPKRSNSGLAHSPPALR